MLEFRDPSLYLLKAGVQISLKGNFHKSSGLYGFNTKSSSPQNGLAQPLADNQNERRETSCPRALGS